MSDPAIPLPAAAVKAPSLPGSNVPFGVNEMRLSVGHWISAVLLLSLALLLTPRVWKRVERFETGPDYRVPYELSRDYWLYERRLGQIHDPAQIFVLGDSVVWGEYVRPDGTLSHFLNAQSGQSDRFINAGVNGLFPLALEGLVGSYGQALHHRKVILQCNLLWMSSPKADLQVQKEEKFNHSRLVPQFSPRIPCYKADTNERLSALVERNVRFVSWVSHLQDCYFDQKNILSWTMEEDNSDPPARPNAYKNPLAQITLVVPRAPQADPQRGPQSARHKPWTASGNGPSAFDWVSLESSLQWGAFQRLVQLLQDRGADLLVVLGPFNEHMIAKESQPGYRQLHDGIAAWLEQHHVPHVVPAVLPTDLYADASHPLTAGYALLAQRLRAQPVFADWENRR